MPAVAPAAGVGALLDSFGWRTIFLLNLPFGVVAMILALISCRYPARYAAIHSTGQAWPCWPLATLVLVETVSSDAATV